MYKRKLEELLQEKEVRGLKLTLVTGEDIYIEKVYGNSDDYTLVVEGLNGTSINLNHVVKVTKVVDEDFVMHDVDFV